MPNKETVRSLNMDTKPVASTPASGIVNKVAPSVTKVVTTKCVKDAAMSPGAPAAAEGERTELLGSLTTQQQQRTSARVIKKLRLEPPADRDKRKPGSDDIPECETPIKIEDKELKFPTVKQRMPKALWSTDEKNLFFEALNEYGKDFDAITAYICAKMKKKGMPDVNLKTKTQVSHFYYRTWHKLSKHVHFDENVKKVAQELYALINYGELRKKLVSVNEKTCARLGEMVLCGNIVVRARGRNLRVRTPMCRALRRLNQITELALGARVCSRAQVSLRARSRAAWARVQASAHNPRAALALPLRTRLRALLRALALRWGGDCSLGKFSENEKLEDGQKETEDYEENEPNRELEEHLNLETDRIIIQEQKAPKKLALHVGPRPGADIHLPVVSPSEQLSSQKICFSSYLERMGSQRHKDSSAKIRTPKRQRKDSTTEKDKEVDQKKFKLEDSDRLINIEETAIDGIELMANYKSLQEDEEKPSTEDEKERETAEDEGNYLQEKDIAEKESERDKDMSEKEKDSFSEMEDDEKYVKSDTDNESDGKDKGGKENKFENLKVKFRLRPKKRGGSIYTLVTDKDPEESKVEEPVKEEEVKPDIDVELALRQIRKGWSELDAGDLTVGDLYLMFGSRSKLELDYWWAEPTPPLPQPQKLTVTIPPDRISDKRDKSDKLSDKLSDKGADSSVEDEKERARESDNDILSPKNTFSQDSNDGMSGDERKCEQLASPEHKSSSGGGTLKVVSKLINRPQANPPENGFSMLGDRLKRLLALAGNPHVSAAANASIARCNCGHVCPVQRKQQSQQKPSASPAAAAGAPDEPVFRHPTPIAPRPDAKDPPACNVLAGLPRWRRGRPRADRRVVVQRLLPLLPKLPSPANMAPMKLVPNSPPAPPRILPKPPPTSPSDLSFFYVLSESNGQFFFHDGDRRIPFTSLAGNGNDEDSVIKMEDDDDAPTNGVKSEAPNTETNKQTDTMKVEATAEENKTEPTEITPEFLPAESMSLSPSRLLHDAEGWLGGAQDFSLSSFLGHLEGRPHQDLAVDSQLHSLMAESSVDYVAKFADLAAEVTDDPDLPSDDLT
ncbi:protein cramped [Trichoplusia ni]|uniref:Protein cramped n=1 Tax=Trichoplusia ni TaxID=7111 RepID=A0A7E5W8D0_TRINI|nr:protein cramped [Trichoplusia ni]